MKRIVTLIDGTWNSETDGGTLTNIARLDPRDASAGARLIAERDAADAFDPGFFHDEGDPSRENVNERVHWSVPEKAADPAYAPRNLPARLATANVAAMTAKEARWLGRRAVP